MAGNEDEGKPLVNTPSVSSEKSQDNAAGEKEAGKQKKAGSSGEETGASKNKPSSSKTNVTKTDFVESIKASITESMAEGFSPNIHFFVLRNSGRAVVDSSEHHHRKSQFSKTVKLTDRTLTTVVNDTTRHKLPTASGRRKWIKSNSNPQRVGE